MTSSATRSIHGRRSVSSVRAQSGLARKARWAAFTTSLVPDPAPSVERCVERVATRPGHGLDDEVATRNMRVELAAANI
jgi:hypothetical protein